MDANASELVELGLSSLMDANVRAR
ncbi:hypothetical protein F383_39280 [Gossypium arboreum]|uniref:Uncharacterized protein n=1 Tax=Gossypium arboreum TaxID=29729 RepID=A0A0B0MRN6_GOSAR|nr:hypothetical protein F383_39280 [Gossypium arboreum]